MSGRRCSKVLGTPLGICGSVMSTIAGLIEKLEADTPSNAAMACSISAALRERLRRLGAGGTQLRLCL